MGRTSYLFKRASHAKGRRRIKHSGHGRDRVRYGVDSFSRHSTSVNPYGHLQIIGTVTSRHRFLALLLWECSVFLLVIQRRFHLVVASVRNYNGPFNYPSAITHRGVCFCSLLFRFLGNFYEDQLSAIQSHRGYR